VAKTLTLNIVTPEKVSWEGSVESLVVPAHEGLLGILPGHAPLLAELSPGTLHIRTAEGEHTLAVSGGFIEVVNNAVSVFAETAELAEEINVERARLALEKAKVQLKASDPAQISPENARAALMRALARMKAAEWARRRHNPANH
jgi:F-type H+-transporting ATPase subunit epsilon